ncbi:hypothetical protein RCZ15_11780, partial [Capnocytophaga catalasegens]
SLENRKKYR